MLPCGARAISRSPNTARLPRPIARRSRSHSWPRATGGMCPLLRFTIIRWRRSKSAQPSPVIHGWRALVRSEPGGAGDHAALAGSPLEEWPYLSSAGSSSGSPCLDRGCPLRCCAVAGRGTPPYPARKRRDGCAQPVLVQQTDPHLGRPRSADAESYWCSIGF